MPDVEKRFKEGDTLTYKSRESLPDKKYMWENDSPKKSCWL